MALGCVWGRCEGLLTYPIFVLPDLWGMTAEPPERGEFEGRGPQLCLP